MNLEFDCLACEVARRGGNTSGLTHSCPESGVWLAAEGRAEGFDVDPSFGLFTVSMTFRVRAQSELRAREKLSGLVGSLLDDDLVEGVEFVITEQPWSEPAESSSTSVIT